MSDFGQDPWGAPLLNLMFQHELGNALGVGSPVVVYWGEEEGQTNEL